MNRHPFKRLVPVFMAGLWPFSLLAAGVLAQSSDQEHSEAGAEDQPQEPLATPAPSSDDDFAELSLEELMNVKVTTVTSVAGVSRPLLETPAAVTVLTAEDISRAGHRSVAEALRMVPGLNVAQISSNEWAITARGFNSEFSTKLLVMIDGRSVYTPLFSGVYWDIQNLVLDDIDRIEVIRGPGATLWGANAVNGVINIVTKSAKDTQGLLMEGGGGTHERGFGTIRYGFKLNENTFLRLYGLYFDRDGSLNLLDHREPDDWAMTQGGFRMDWSDQKEYSLTLQGDAYGTGQLGETLGIPTYFPPFSKNVVSDEVVDGGNLLLRLKRDISADEGWSIQAYIDRTRRAAEVFDEDRNTFDLDIRHRFLLNERNKILWGVGFRHGHGETEGTRTFRYVPKTRSDDTFSAFIQDTIVLVPDRLSLMLGSKFEANDFTGFEAQPSARLSWTPDPKHTVWTSVSRAVRTPSIVNENFDLTLAVVPAPVPTPIRLLGDTELDSEELIAYELGYRWQPTERLSFDVATFFNDYDDVIGVRPRIGDPFTLVFDNTSRAESYGVEFETTWKVTDWWRLTGAYSFLKLNAVGDDTAFEGGEPEHQFNVRSMVDITKNLELNAALYYVDHLRATDVPSYIRFDLGVTWRPRPNVEVSVWGQNLIDDRHPEFIDVFELPDRPLEAERGVFAAIKLSF